MATESHTGVLRDRCGLEVHCSSQEAMDRYNQGLIEYVRSYGDSMASFGKALELDNGFFLINCTLGSMWLSVLKKPSDPLVATHLDAVNKLSSDQVLPREQFHIDAFKAYASGDLPAACDHWERCTIDYPKDALATRNAFVGRLMLGQLDRSRANLSYVLTYWKKEDPLYPFILSLYSFTLEETGRFQDASTAAWESLSMNPQAPWATHALGHVIEEDRDVHEGVGFLTSTRDHWKDSGLGNHIAWHLCLYYFDLGDTEAVLKEYDGNLVNKVVSSNLFGLLDASSLLWRLECDGVDVGDRWTKVHEAFKAHLDNRALVWYDTHLMMSLVYGGLCNESAARFALAEHLIKSLKDYSQSGRSTDCKVAEVVGAPTCEALLAYGKQQFDEVVSLLVPRRYDIVRLGGSWAQRQVFSVTFIQAAIKAGKLKLALSLIAELKAVKPKSHRLAVLYTNVQQMITSKDS
ncbi:tetratricopeptide repeat protein 38-like [Dysidea avara]|uniref:tetratricopeptide repeat protein 38-like n=1 Tax=Dysidea avara TaxID=196820 RepID=UPI00331D739B